MFFAKSIFKNSKNEDNHTKLILFQLKKIFFSFLDKIEIICIFIIFIEFMILSKRKFYDWV